MKYEKQMRLKRLIAIVLSIAMVVGSIYVGRSTSEAADELIYSYHEGTTQLSATTKITEKDGQPVTLKELNKLILSDYAVVEILPDEDELTVGNEDLTIILEGEATLRIGNTQFVCNEIQSAAHLEITSGGQLKASSISATDGTITNLGTIKCDSISGSEFTNDGVLECDSIVAKDFTNDGEALIGSVSVKGSVANTGTLECTSLTIDTGNTFYNTGGTLKMSSFDNSTFSGKFRNEGTVVADTVALYGLSGNFDTNYNVAVYQVKKSFVMDGFNTLIGTVKAQEDTKISSNGGSFILNVGDKTKELVLDDEYEYLAKDLFDLTSLDDFDRVNDEDYFTVYKLVNGEKVEANNRYVQETLILEPKSVYLAKSSVSGSEYDSSVQLTKDDIFVDGEENPSLILFLKDKETGKYAWGYPDTMVQSRALSYYIFDNTPPTATVSAVADGETVDFTDGAVFRAEELTLLLNITEENHDGRIFYDGTNTVFIDEDNKAEITFTSDPEKSAETHTISIRDLAENELKYTFKLGYPKLDPEASISVEDFIVGEGTVTPVLETKSEKKDDAVIEYKPIDAPEDDYSTTEPTAIGKYRVRATIPESTTYEEGVCENTFEIRKKLATVTITIADCEVGDDYDPTYTCDSTGAVTWEYKYKGSADSSYTETKPTAAGNYTVRATIAETDTYQELTGTANFTISKKSASVKITIADSYVGETYEPTVQCDSTGTRTFQYKVQGAADSTYTSTQPTAAGNYTVRARIAATDTYYELSNTANFTISRKTASVTVTISDCYVGATYAPEVTKESDADYTIEYKYYGTLDSSYTTTKPTAAGKYTVRAMVPQTDTYNEAEDTADFTIKLKETTATVTIDDCFVGDLYEPDVDTNSDGSITIEYKEKSAMDTTYTETPPTDAGEYMVRATIAESETYEQKVVFDDFEIKKRTATVTVSLENPVAGTTYTPTVTCDSTGAVTWEYKGKGADDDTYTTTPPIAAGDYTVRATIAETATYVELTGTKDFTIIRDTTTATVTLEDTYVGSPLVPEVVTVSTGAKTFEYKKSGADDSTYTTTEPTAVGEYVVRVTIAATATYEEITCTDTFEILAKKTATVTVSVDNTVIGTPYTPTATCESGGAVTFEYKIWDYDDDAYSDTKPTAAGKYMVRATVAETATYEELTGTAIFTISRKSTTATVTVPDTIVGDSYDSDVDTNSNGTPTFLYKVQGAADSTYTGTKPTAAGDYTVQATVPETDEFEKKTCTANFTISRKTGTATVTIDDVYVDETYTPLVDTDSDGSITIEYKETSAMDSTYTEEKPTAAGEYMVRATIAETDTYKKIVVFDEFTISKIQPTSSVTVGTVYVGNTYTPVVDTDSNGSQTIEYKTSTAPDLSYVTLAPTGIGEYTVRVTIAETEKYKESVCTTTFQITVKQVATVTVNVENTVVGTDYDPEVTCESTGLVTLEYKVKGADDDTYTTTKPTAAGDYTVRATVGETLVYAELTGTANFTISRKTTTATVSVADTKIGESYDPVVNTNSDGTATFLYKVKGAEDTTYKTAKPTAAGDYTVQATIPETDEYEKKTCTADFTISKLTGTATVTLADTYVGTALAPVVEKESTGAVTFEYKKSDAEDSTYTTTEPTAVGEYVVHATIAETATYERIICTDTFEILAKKTAAVTLSIESTVIGTTYAPTASCESDGAITFDYKVQGAEDDTYTSTRPTAAGDYTVRATVAETATYEKLTETADFTISRKTTTATVTVADTTVGETYAPVVETNSDGTATFLYKVKGAEDTTYTSAKPTAAGDYTVQATVPETDEYEKYICTDDFTISKKSVTATVTIDDCFVGDVYTPVVDTDSDGAYTFEYKEKSAMDTTYTDAKPTAAGEYMVRATIAATATYEKIVVTDDFTISRIKPTSSVTVANVYVGTTIVANVDTDSNGAITVEYKEASAEDSTYTDTEPTAVGEYSVRATTAETETYEKSVCTGTFKITAKKVATVTVSVESTVIGTDYAPTASCASGGAITFDYKVQGAADSTYTPTKPTAAGSYTVRATAAETDEYAEQTGTANFTISRKTTTASVALAGIYVGEEIDPYVETNSNGIPTFLYKVKGADDSTYKTAKPTAAGDYTVQVTIPETDEYEKYVCTGDFTINKYLPSASISVEDTVIGTTYAPKVETNSDGTVTIEYRKSGADVSTYTDVKPTAAGDYEVRATIAESANFKGITCTDTFTISKKKPTASIEVVDYFIGYDPVPHVDTDSDGAYTVMYRKEEAEDSSFSTSYPAVAGEYVARATIDETDTYQATSCTCTFRVTAREIPDVIFSISNTHVGEEPTVIIFHTSDAEATVEYKVYGEDDSTYQPERPTAAGYYNARLTLPETAKYEGVVRVTSFRIEKIVPTASITVADTIVGQDYSPKLVSDSDGAVTYEYKAKEAEDSAYTTEKPAAVGEYQVRAIIAETEKYERIVCSDTFRISPKKTATVTIDIDDITIGEKYDPKVTSASDGAVTIEYKEADAADTTYTETKPTAAGSYTIRATVAETETYVGLTETAAFRINKKTATATVTVSDTTEGSSYTPSVTTTSDGKASFEYKKSTEDDSAYTTTPPDSAGTYTVRATIEETETYKQVVCTADFKIHKEVKPEPEPEPGPIPEKRTPYAQIKLRDVVYYGTFYAAEISSDSDAKDMQILFRNRGTGSGYFLDQPTAPGSYSILLTMPATDTCNAVRMEKSFEISFLPAPSVAYGFDGTVGNNDFFTTDIRVVAPKGYEIATELDGTYKESVDYDAVERGIFLRRISDGAKTAAISVSESLKKDKERPKLSSLITDENGKSLSTMGDYYANELHLSIEDENLILVRVNNMLMQVDDALAELILETNGGEEMYTIYAEDAAGNGFTLSVHLFAAWMKTGVMPAGMKVILKKGTAYKLEEGQWTRSGDTTVYNGGGEFYVDNDTECTFDKVN